MAVKHIVFDWDGTLADTYPVIAAAYKHTFAALGLPPIPYSEIRRLTSTLPNRDTFGYIFGTQKNVATQAYYDYISRNHLTSLKAQPDAQNLLEFCRHKNLQIYLLTNKKRPFIISETDRLGFTSYFNKITAAGDLPHDKPHPEAARSLFGSALPDAGSIMVIGDGAADYQVARTYDHAGQKALCVIYNPDGLYDGDQPDYTVTSLNDIIAILEKLS